MRVFRMTITSALLATCLLFQFSLNAQAEGYGGFKAYMKGLAANELIAVRAAPNNKSQKLGAILGSAEDIDVHWCDKFAGIEWCDVTHKKLRGWIIGKNLQNNEGG